MTTTTAELQDIVAAKVADARGVGCPGPLLEAKKAMPGVPIGAVVEVWSTDPVTKTDIAASNGVIHVIDTVIMPPKS